jgi:hypothetical protein
MLVDWGIPTTESIEKALEIIKLTKKQSEVTIFACGTVKPQGLKARKLHE